MTMALVSGQWRYKGYIEAYLRELAIVGNAKRKTIYHYTDYPMQYRNTAVLAITSLEEQIYNCSQY